MNLYTETTLFFENMLRTNEWPDLKATFHRFAAQQPQAWKLPQLACEAVGGPKDQAIPGVTALACAQISIILIDDMLDNDPRGDYHRLGHAATSNLAVSFCSAGIKALQPPFLSPAPPAITQSLSQMMLITSLGQYLDSQGVQDEEAYWKLVQFKSSPFYGAALQIGALLGGADEHQAEQLFHLGQLYGAIIQLHDDINDTMDSPASPDWTNPATSLPILFATCVNHPDRARFLTLRQKSHEPEALQEAQTILLRCGAISYAVDQLLQKYLMAQKLLKKTPLKKREELEKILTEVINPVLRVYDATTSLEEKPELLQLVTALDGGE
ncbi:MAG: hypothetical protein Fur0022_22090 [Anaerolineales bacterium]